MQPGTSRVVLTDGEGRLSDAAPAIPEKFLTELRAFDRDLFILWSQTRKRFFLYQCVEHCTTGAPINNGHTQLCRSIYVLVVADKDGEMVPFNERVINTLREMKANSESFGGETERGLRNAIQHSNNIDQKLAAKRAAAVEDAYEHNRKFNRISFNRLWNWAETHLFTAPNK